MADADRDGELSRHELAVAMHLAACVTGKGKAKELQLPRVLPACLATVAQNTGGDDKALQSTERDEEVIGHADEEVQLDRGASQNTTKGQQDVDGGGEDRLTSADSRDGSEYRMNDLEKRVYDEAYDRLVNGTSTTLGGREVRTGSTGGAGCWNCRGLRGSRNDRILFSKYNEPRVTHQSNSTPYASARTSLPSPPPLRLPHPSMIEDAGKLV